MPDLETSSANFDRPIERPALTGVELDPATTIRVGYRVLPEGGGCLHLELSELPSEVYDYFLAAAKQQVERDHA